MTRVDIIASKQHRFGHLMDLQHIIKAANSHLLEPSAHQTLSSEGSSRHQPRGLPIPNCRQGKLEKTDSRDSCDSHQPRNVISLLDLVRRWICEHLSGKTLLLASMSTLHK